MAARQRGFGATLIVKVDRDSLTYETFDLPPGVAPYGITVDHKFTGLRDPYTYSDMTGNALGSVACTPEG